jgi:hypothetical protein
MKNWRFAMSSRKVLVACAIIVLTLVLVATERFETKTPKVALFSSTSPVTFSQGNSSMKPVVTLNDKFLVFASHSGFSNQLVGLARAAVLAKISDRVLVIPPVLAHKAVKFGGSRSCDAVGQARVIEAANEAYRSKTEGSFKSLFNFDEKLLFEMTGLKIIFWQDFENQIMAHIGENEWKFEYSTLNCGRKNGTLEEIRTSLKSNEEYHVLNIGSAFMSRVHRFTNQEQDESAQKSYDFLIEYFKAGANFREEIREVAFKMLNASYSSPRNIFSVHMRTGDSNQYSAEIIKDTIRAIDQEISMVNPKEVEVFFATDLPNASSHPLLQDFLSRYSKVFDLQTIELMEGNRLIESTAKHLRVTNDLLSIVLDQYICSIGKNFYSGAKQFSTFTGLIISRRKRLNLKVPDLV